MNSTETNLIDKLKHVLLFLPKFYKNPVLSIQNAPNLEWVEVISLQIIVSMASGILSGLVSQNFLYAIWGAFFFEAILELLQPARRDKKIMVIRFGNMEKEFILVDFIRSDLFFNAEAERRRVSSFFEKQLLTSSTIIIKYLFNIIILLNFLMLVLMFCQI